MSIQAPYNLLWNGNVQIIDAANSNTLYFSTSGEISTSYQITILNNSTNAIVFQTSQIQTLATNYVLSEASISNGNTYKVQVTVWAVDGSSASSNYLIFSAYSTPVITLTSSTTVNAPSFNFTGSFLQSQSQNISYWEMFLYDSNYNLINQSGIQTSSTIQYTFNLLTSNTNYYLEIQATSSGGLTGTSGKIFISVSYSQPSAASVLTATNYNDYANELSFNVLVIEGTSTGTVSYINNEKIDCTNGTVVFNSGYTVYQNFTMRLWLENVQNKKDLVTINGENGSLRLQYHWLDNCFHLYKNVNGCSFTDEWISLPCVSNAYFVGIEQVDGNCNLYAEPSSI